MPRILPDSFDQIVWPLTEISGNYRNVGSFFPNDPSTDLSITNTIIRTGAGIYGGNCPQFPSTSNFPTGSSSTRNYIAGAKNYIPSPPLTVSCWVYLRSYTTAQNAAIFAKEYRDSSITPSWTTPFTAIGISTLTTNGGGDWVASIATSASTVVSQNIIDFPIPLGVWSHIGMTYDGTNMRVYLNGCQMIYYSGATQLNSTAVGAISYTDGVNGFGFWKLGATTATGSTNREESSANIQDVRIANVARPLSYFKKIYAANAFPIKASTSGQFYKLRAYDTSCVTPTYVTWVDTQVSLANAPSFPCIGPYSAPEILETWYA